MHDKTFTNDLIGSYNKHRKTLINVFLDDTGLSSELTTVQKEQGKVLKEQLNLGASQGINWDALAKKIGMADLYNTVYRSTSGNAAHVTLPALDRHICTNTQGEFEKLVFQPDARDVAQTLSMAVCSLLNAIEQLNQVVPVGNAITEFMKRWFAISQAKMC